MAERVLLHVGVHKTGTTSIQAFLGAHREELRRRGVDFFTGEYLPINHIELHVAAMRTERMSPYKHEKGLRVTDDLRQRIGARVRAFVEASPAPLAVFSNEGLSLLRHDDEMARLKDLMAGRPARIVMYTRNAADFLRSYAQHLTTRPNLMPKVIAPDSFAYTQPDSWLADFGERIAAFRRAFGDVSVVDYDREMAAHANVFPSFLRLLGLPEDWRHEEWDRFWLNRTPKEAAQ